MKIRFLVLLIIMALLSSSSMIVIADTAKISDLKLYDGNPVALNTGALKNMVETLQSIADGYSPYSRLGWSVVVNGEQLSDKSNWEYGYGQINGYDKSKGILSGPGYLFRASIGQGENALVKSLGMCTISIDVKTNQATFTSNTNAETLGIYVLEKGMGNGVFYGSGDSPLFASPMCIIELSNAQTSQNTSGNDVLNWNIEANSANTSTSDTGTKNSTQRTLKTVSIGKIG